MKKLLLIFGLICICLTSNAQHSVNLYASQDLYVETYGGGQGKNAFMKFNISALPPGIAITGAYFNAYVYKWQLGWDGDVKWIHYNNQTWAEGDSNKHMWIPAYFVDTLTQLNGFGTNLNAINTSIDLKDFLKVDYAASHTYFSFFGKDVDDPTSWPNMTAVSFNNSDSMLCGNIFGDMMGFRPHDYINPNQWPYLTVQYGILPIAGAVIGSSSACEGDAITMNAAATGDPVLNYQWQKNGVNIPGATSTTLTISPLMLSDAGNYRFYVTNLYGADTSNTNTLIVNPLPTLSITASSNTICEGESATLNAGGASSYVWCCPAYVGNPFVISPIAPTTYYVTGTSVAGCSSNAAITINVTPAPDLTITASPDTICQGDVSVLTVSGASSYAWNTGSLGTPLTVSPTSTTTYTVTGTAGGCSTTGTVVVTVIICSGVSEQNQRVCEIYPNPAKDEINIQTPSGPMHIMIFNAEGMKVDEIYSPVSTARVSLSNRAAGIYTVKIISGKNVFVKKVILQ
ncbi:MAG: T9SS type A sorting domain-containing protein [Bacteroidota bacterium]